MTEGDSFGEVSLVLGDVRSASIYAVTNCNMFQLNYDGLKEAYESYPHQKTRILETIKQHLKRSTLLATHASQKSEGKLKGDRSSHSPASPRTVSSLAGVQEEDSEAQEE